MSTRRDSVRFELFIEWPSWSRRRGRKSGSGSRCAARRRPFLAPSAVRREPSVWGLVSGPLKPSSHVGFGLAMPNRPAIRRAGNFHFSCRRSSMPVTTPSPVTSAIPAILPSLAISRRLRRPQSPFPRLFEFGGCASGERDWEYSESARSSLAVNAYRTET